MQSNTEDTVLERKVACEPPSATFNRTPPPAHGAGAHLSFAIPRTQDCGHQPFGWWSLAVSAKPVVPPNTTSAADARSPFGLEHKPCKYSRCSSASPSLGCHRAVRRDRRRSSCGSTHSTVHAVRPKRPGARTSCGLGAARPLPPSLGSRQSRKLRASHELVSGLEGGGRGGRGWRRSAL